MSKKCDNSKYNSDLFKVINTTNKTVFRRAKNKDKRWTKHNIFWMKSTFDIVKNSKEKINKKAKYPSKYSEKFSLYEEYCKLLESVNDKLKSKSNDIIYSRRYFHKKWWINRRTKLLEDIRCKIEKAQTKNELSEKVSHGRIFFGLRSSINVIMRSKVWIGEVNPSSQKTDKNKEYSEYCKLLLEVQTKLKNIMESGNATYSPKFFHKKWWIKWRMKLLSDIDLQIDRSKAIEQISEKIKHKKNIIINGRYGTGKTAIVESAIKYAKLEDRWHGEHRFKSFFRLFKNWHPKKILQIDVMKISEEEFASGKFKRHFTFKGKVRYALSNFSASTVRNLILISGAYYLLPVTMVMWDPDEFGHKFLEPGTVEFLFAWFSPIFLAILIFFVLSVAFLLSLRKTVVLINEINFLDTNSQEKLNSLIWDIKKYYKNDIMIFESTDNIDENIKNKLNCEIVTIHTSENVEAYKRLIENLVNRLKDKYKDGGEVWVWKLGILEDDKKLLIEQIDKNKSSNVFATLSYREIYHMFKEFEDDFSDLDGEISLYHFIYSRYVLLNNIDLYNYFIYDFNYDELSFFRREYSMTVNISHTQSSRDRDARFIKEKIIDVFMEKNKDKINHRVNDYKKIDEKIIADWGIFTITNEDNDGASTISKMWTNFPIQNEIFRDNYARSLNSNTKWQDEKLPVANNENKEWIFYCYTDKQAWEHIDSLNTSCNNKDFREHIKYILKTRKSVIEFIKSLDIDLWNGKDKKDKNVEIGKIKYFILCHYFVMLNEKTVLNNALFIKLISDCNIKSKNFDKNLGIELEYFYKDLWLKNETNETKPSSLNLEIIPAYFDEFESDESINNSMNKVKSGIFGNTFYNIDDLSDNKANKEAVGEEEAGKNPADGSLLNNINDENIIHILYIKTNKISTKKKIKENLNGKEVYLRSIENYERLAEQFIKRVAFRIFNRSENGENNQSVITRTTSEFYEYIESQNFSWLQKGYIESYLLCDDEKDIYSILLNSGRVDIQALKEVMETYFESQKSFGNENN